MNIAEAKKRYWKKRVKVGGKTGILIFLGINEFQPSWGFHAVLKGDDGKEHVVQPNINVNDIYPA